MQVTAKHKNLQKLKKQLHQIHIENILQNAQLHQRQAMRHHPKIILATKSWHNIQNLRDILFPVSTKTCIFSLLMSIILSVFVLFFLLAADVQKVTSFCECKLENRGILTLIVLGVGWNYFYYYTAKLCGHNNNILLVTCFFV